MIVLDVEQGSQAWADARLDIPTASCFGEIIQPKKLGYSTSAAKYRARLLAQWVCGYPLEGFTPTGAMLRGTDLEAEARAWYEMQRDVEVVPVGFVMRDDGSSGGSPDGLVGSEGGVEIKVPLMTTHLEYLLADELPAAHIAQVQGYMYLTDRRWWDFVSYAPGLPCVLGRIERDDKFITQLHRHIGRFREELLAGKRKLIACGFTPRPGSEPPEDVSIANERLVTDMYGEVPEETPTEVPDATEAQLLALKQLRSMADGLVSIDDQQGIADAIKSRDGQMVPIWIRTIERRIAETVKS